MKIKYFYLTLAFLCSIGMVQAQDMLLLKSTGKVVIGDLAQITTPGDYALYVQHGILTERVKVSLHQSDDWSDDAWDKTPSLAEVAQSIIDRRHLIDMPSADQLVETGYDVTDMDSKLLQQIEWLWQHMIALQKENEVLRQEVHLLRTSK